MCVCSICLMISAGKLAILKLMKCFMGCLTLAFAAVEHVNARQFLQLIHKNVRCAGRVMPEYNRGLSRQISVCLQTSSLKITVDKHVGMAHHWLSENCMLKVQIGYLKMWWSKSTLKHMYTSNTSKNLGFHGCKFWLTPKCVEGRRVWRTLMLWMTVLLRKWFEAMSIIKVTTGSMFKPSHEQVNIPQF
jgi:hypothetical protein